MPFVDWSSLPAELLNRIAECFLATSDMDYYIDFRAVCQSWRSATEDPKNSPDPRFRPRHWVMIYEVYESTTRLLVNTTTGRFLRKELPLLHNYFLTAATSDGLLIMKDRDAPQSVSVLNPLTGYNIRFIALPPNTIVESAALVSASSPSIVLNCKTYVYDDVDAYREDNFVYCESFRDVYIAEPCSESFAVYVDRDTCPLIRLAARGIYTDGKLGPVIPFPFAVTKRIFDMMRVFNPNPAEDTMMCKVESKYGNRFFLVSSAGEMLIICKLQEGMEVYRIDADRCTLERVDNIGNKAIFLGPYCRCMSVNADKFPSVDANCIYYMKGIRDGIYMYNIMRQREEIICKNIYVGSAPYTIIQHLCDRV